MDSFGQTGTHERKHKDQFHQSGIQISTRMASRITMPLKIKIPIGFPTPMKTVTGLIRQYKTQIVTASSI